MTSLTISANSSTDNSPNPSKLLYRLRTAILPLRFMTAQIPKTPANKKQLFFSIL